MKRDLDDRLLRFSVRVIKLIEALPATASSRRIGDQLLRSGTSVGANYQEAQAAESRQDFVHKLQVALKELRESNYWLRMIQEAEIMPAPRMHSIVDESTQLVAIVSKCVAKAKEPR